jgi:hypothetical protein
MPLPFTLDDVLVLSGFSCEKPSGAPLSAALPCAIIHFGSRVKRIGFSTGDIRPMHSFTDDRPHPIASVKSVYKDCGPLIMV